MDDDMRKALLNKKSGTFDKPYEECLIKIQKIKQKNDFMQKQVGTDLEQTVKKQLAKQRQFIQKQIKELKTLMDDMQKKFRDPEAKNKLKNLKSDAHRQIQRNQKIMEQFIDKSFLRISRGSADHDDDADHYMQGGKVSYGNLDAKNRGNNAQRRRGQDQPSSERRFKPDSLLTQQNLGVDFEIERKILQEKKMLLNDVQQATVRVNAIMNDMAIIVDEHGQNLNIISEQMMRTNKNLIEANNELDSASKLQKKFKRKYFLCALMIIILVLAVLGVVFFGNVV